MYKVFLGVVEDIKIGRYCFLFFRSFLYNEDIVRYICNVVIKYVDERGYGNWFDENWLVLKVLFWGLRFW